MNEPWLEREALVVVKAYPNPSAKYHETVCVAAITREEGWVRLYPVQFRSLPEERRFKKYQIIRFRMRKHDRDPRPESYRVDENSIELLDVVGAEHQWAKRRQWLDPTVSRSMCEIQVLQKTTGKSMGVFKPRRVTDFLIEDGPAQWTGKQQSEVDQLMLFDEQTTKLERIPFVFRYKYLCDDDNCRGHSQSIIDWELMELYRNLRATAGGPNEIKAKIRQKYFGELCGDTKDTHIFVGNHSRYPITFMVLGVFWPPKRPQKSLF
jgi:hypothetical protein